MPKNVVFWEMAGSIFHRLNALCIVNLDLHEVENLTTMTSGSCHKTCLTLIFHGYKLTLFEEYTRLFLERMWKLQYFRILLQRLLNCDSSFGQPLLGKLCTILSINSISNFVMKLYRLCRSCADEPHWCFLFKAISKCFDCGFNAIFIFVK